MSTIGFFYSFFCSVYIVLRNALYFLRTVPQAVIKVPECGFLAKTNIGKNTVTEKYGTMPRTRTEKKVKCIRPRLPY